MKKIVNFIIIILVFITVKTKGQSTNCTTATNLSLNNGTACVNGTSSGAVTDNILYGNCNTVPVNMVWYTYVTNGSNNSFTITPGTLTNAEIVIYQGGCPNTGTLQTCVVANGSAPIVTSWGMTAGVQTWIGIASNNGVSGSFNFCVSSQPPAVGAGNTCAQAIPICTLPYSKPNIPSNSSGQLPTCFASAPQQDIWIKFTIKQAGLLAWLATPTSGTTEFDWCLWDITGGCPGTVACCNYNYAAGSSLGFGMQAQTGTVACGFNSLGTTQNEFCGPMNVTCGKIYAIQISNYSNDNTGFNLTFPGSTCLITSNAAFAVTPTLTCGASLNASINNLSTGACTGEVWTFGDGSASYSGLTPPVHTYTTPGTYAITASIGGVCPSTASQFVQLLAPLAATVAPTPINCAGNCTGSATVTAVSGGDGVYTYLWSNGNTTPNVSGLCAGVYSVTISNVICGSSITKTVSIVAPPALTLTGTPTNATCGNNNGSIIVSASGGTAPYQFSINGGVFSATTNFTGLFAGTYTMAVKDNKNCQITLTVTITQTPPPIVTVTSATTCPGVPVILTAAGATTYSWSPATGLSSTTGANVTATVAASTNYTVTGTSSGCTATAVAVISMFSNPTPSATSNSPICAGTALNLIGSGGATYTWTGPATYTSNTQSPIIASALVTNSGTYTLTVTDANGCKNFTTTSVVVNAIPVPIANNTGPYCVGTTISLTGSGGGTYSWSGPSAFSSALQNPTIPTSTLSNAGTYTLLITLNTCTALATTNVIVSTATTSASNTGPYCAGTTIQLNAPAATSYTWTGPSAFLSNLQNPIRPTSTPAMSGTYTVVISIGTCTASATTSVTVNALPTPIANSNNPICTGANLLLTASGGTAYAWTGPLGFTSAVQNPTITNALITNSGVYSLTVIDANGCQATTSTPVVINTSPNLLANGATVCFGYPATLTATGGVTYSWVGPNGFTSNLQNPTLPVVNNNTTGNYTVTITGVNTCTSASAVNVGTYPLPVPSITSTPKTCIYTPISLQGSPGFLMYQWTGPNNFLSPNVATSFTANSLSQSGIYTLSVTDNRGCVGSTSTLVIIDPLPNATVLVDKNKKCVPFCSNFTMQTGPGSASIVTGSWSFNTQTFNGISLNYCVTNAGDYLINASYTDANGCSNNTSYTLNAYPIPTAMFEYSPAKPLEMVDEVTFTDGSSGPEINSWHWYFMSNSGYQSTSQNPLYTFEKAGVYPIALVVTNKWGCSDTVVKSIIVGEGNSFYIPNAFTPNGDGINDTFFAKGFNVSKFEMTIFDRWGEKLFHTNELGGEWNGTFKGQDCKDDVYVWKVSVTMPDSKTKVYTGHVTINR
jgi:gliding motility-associated-like protein